ncbi:Copia protein, partial [Mucuna pruriens]
MTHTNHLTGRHVVIVGFLPTGCLMPTDTLMKAKVRQFRSKLKNTKKGSRTISEYLLRIKVNVDSPVAIGDSISKQDHINAMLDGLLEALHVFRQFHEIIKTQSQANLKAVQSDWGGEFRPFTKCLTDQGIVHRLTCPHTSHQNGTVERKHRQIVEMGSTLLTHASMSLLSHNPVLHSWTKYIELDVHFVREKVASNTLIVQNVPASKQLAYSFTKPLSSSRFCDLHTKLKKLENQPNCDQKAKETTYAMQLQSNSIDCIVSNQLTCL